MLTMIWVNDKLGHPHAMWSTIPTSIREFTNGDEGEHAGKTAPRPSARFASTSRAVAQIAYKSRRTRN